MDKRMNDIASYMAKFRPNLGKFWPKRALFQISPKNQSRHYFLTPETRLPAKIRKFQCAVFRKNAKNTHFWEFWTKKANFVPFWPKRGHFRIFGEKVKTSILLIFFIFQYKNQKILMRGFSRKCAHTD